MMKKAILLCVSALLAFAATFWPESVAAQSMDELKETLFSKTEKKLVQAQAEQAATLAPRPYEQALKKYNEALRDFKGGKSLKDIEEKLSEVNSALDQCLRLAKQGQAAFATVLNAREDAIDANAPEYAREKFAQAESKFKEAATRLEKAEVREAKRSIPELERLYRDSELTAIKASIIGTVRNLIEEAKREKANEYTPITFANAQKLLNEAEAILNSNRRSESNAKEKAEQAEIEARHAIYLTKQIKRLKKNPEEWENYVLDTEILIENIADELGFTAEFDEGLAKPLKRVHKISQSLQREKKQLQAEVAEKTEEIQKLSEEVKKYKEKERGLQAELQEKQYKLEVKRQREEKIQSLQTMFAENEASVLIKGNTIIIRLIGLTFPSGKATIEPEFFSLLTTLQRAIRKFPNAALTIEGHTDSRGNDQLNQNLSYERALAVKQYLLANMGLDDSRITALGYGESKPIASNETSDGRAQNRRIDVLLTFTEGTL